MKRCRGYGSHSIGSADLRRRTERQQPIQKEHISNAKTAHNVDLKARYPLIHFLMVTKLSTAREVLFACLFPINSGFKFLNN
jgi:hypothetical protein